MTSPKKPVKTRQNLSPISKEVSYNKTEPREPSYEHFDDVNFAESEQREDRWDQQYLSPG